MKPRNPRAGKKPLPSYKIMLVIPPDHPDRGSMEHNLREAIKNYIPEQYKVEIEIADDADIASHRLHADRNIGIIAVHGYGQNEVNQIADICYRHAPRNYVFYTTPHALNERLNFPEASFHLDPGQFGPHPVTEDFLLKNETELLTTGFSSPEITFRFFLNQFHRDRQRMAQQHE